MSEIFTNPTEEEIRQLLTRIKHIAVVGLSPKATRPSHKVAKALQGFGYHIIPVRPAVDEVLGEQAYASLYEVDQPIDVVDVFRAPDQIAPIIDACIEKQVPRFNRRAGRAGTGNGLARFATNHLQLRSRIGILTTTAKTEVWPRGRPRSRRRDHGVAARSRARMPLGCGADFRDHCSLYRRGSLRSCRRHSSRRHGRPKG